MPRWVSHLKPTAGCQISTLIFEYFFCGGGCGSLWIYHYNIWRTAKLLPIFGTDKGIVRTFKCLKCLGRFMHLKPTAGCQISTLIFECFFVEGGLYKYPMKNIWRTAKFLPTFDIDKGIARVLNWLKSLGGFLHLKSTTGCQISTLIFNFFLWKGGLYKYPIKIYEGRQSSCPF